GSTISMPRAFSRAPNRSSPWRPARRASCRSRRRPPAACNSSRSRGAMAGAWWARASAWRRCRTRRVTDAPRPPLPPFTAETAAQKARAAEDAWNSREPERVSLAYTADSVWRNRSEFFQGREAIKAFLTRKWAKELDYRLIKEVWTFGGNRIAVRFAYE